MLLHEECAEAYRPRRQRFSFPVKLRLKPIPLFTRRFEAQLHWQPVVQVGRHRDPFHPLTLGGCWTAFTPTWQRPQDGRCAREL
jgi:hypothetical protein